MFKEPLVFTSKEEAVRKLYDCFVSYRPFFADPYKTKLVYAGNMGPNIGWSEKEAKQIQRSGQFEILGDYTSVKGFKMTGNHGIGDGIAYLGLLPRVDSLGLPEPIHSLHETSIKSRQLTFSQEIQCLVYYIAAMINIIIEKKETYVGSNKKVEMSRETLHKIDGKSFTTSLINRTYPILKSTLDKDTIIYCIPAAIESPRERGLKIPHNSFVPVILPWSTKGGHVQEMCLHSKAVKFMGWLICQLIVYTDSKWLRDLFMDRVDIVLSSLMASDRPLRNVDSFHVLSPVSNTIPFTVNAITIGTETFLTAASSHEKLDAKRLLEEIASKY
jgi:hypothetical protein